MTAITIQPGANLSIDSGVNGFQSASYAQGMQGLPDANEYSAAWDFADTSDYEGGIPTAGSEWSTGPSDARQGLYWFWDPGWDQLYKDTADWP